MPTLRNTPSPAPAEAPAERARIDLEELSLRTEEPVASLRAFAGISDPSNRHVFSAEAPRQAFAHVSLFRV
jgi:hypothetical protein